MIDINGWEFVIIVVIAVVLIGPERLPHYAAKLRTLVQDVKKTAEGAKAQLREQLGPEYEDIDWKAYDPRQYDPRRIVREALLESEETPAQPVVPPTPITQVFDPDRRTPYDDEAT